MKLTLGLSPCPNDTFVFDALIHQKIDTEELDFQVIFEDVEVLNKKALRAELEVTKLSFYTYLQVVHDYVLLPSGSALGFGVGPLLISKANFSLSDLQSRPHLRVGIPGKYTTANFLLNLIAPQLQNKQEMIFSLIEDALLEDKIDLGLIIHENRFTYQARGLKKIIDLGAYWEMQTKCAIPLGGIVIKRTCETSLQQKVNRLIRRSLEFALAHPQSALDFIRAHAQEIDEQVIYQHIQLYVNHYTRDLGEEGRKAITAFYNEATKRKLVPPLNKSLFII